MTTLNKTRRTVVKAIAATGTAAIGLTAFSSSVAAQDITVGDDEVDSYPIDDSDIEIHRGNKNAYFQEINVEITDTEFDDETGTGTVSGIVSGTVLPTENANERAAKEFSVPFEDAPVTHEETVDNPTELVRLVIPHLFLDVLGLQITLDLFLLVEADPEGGLLGRLLDALLG